MVYVGVIGASGRSAPPPQVLAAAEQAGRALARAGAVVVCGGGDGVMESVSRGVADGGGHCVGLLPGARRQEGNAFLSIAIATALGDARNAVIVSASDVLIAIGVGLGTLSEIALALGAGKHVVGLQTWDLLNTHEHMHAARDPEEAVRLALALEGGP
ncbi:MAG TPA: TIGR00725 family protein [Solirubrobacteraceae bacterium]|nr:TIGR00725 family protein [Solirubrobacteraceae bacterium]